MLKFVFYILLLISCLFFGFNNSTEINLIIFPASFEIQAKLYYIIFVFFLIGFFISYLFYSTKFFRLKMTLRSLKKKNQFLEKQLDSNNKEDDSSPLMLDDVKS